MKKMKKRKERRFDVNNNSNNNYNNNNDDDDDSCNQSLLHPSDWTSAAITITTITDADDAAAFPFSPTADTDAATVSFLTNTLKSIIKQSTCHRLSAYHHSCSNGDGDILSILLIWHILYLTQTEPNRTECKQPSFAISWRLSHLLCTSLQEASAMRNDELYNKKIKKMTRDQEGGKKYQLNWKALNNCQKEKRDSLTISKIKREKREFTQQNTDTHRHRHQQQ